MRKWKYFAGIKHRDNTSIMLEWYWIAGIVIVGALILFGGLSLGIYAGVAAGIKNGFDKAVHVQVGVGDRT